MLERLRTRLIAWRRAGPMLSDVKADGACSILPRQGEVAKRADSDCRESDPSRRNHTSPAKAGEACIHSGGSNSSERAQYPPPRSGRRLAPPLGGREFWRASRLSAGRGALALAGLICFAVSAHAALVAIAVQQRMMRFRLLRRAMSITRIQYSSGLQSVPSGTLYVCMITRPRHTTRHTPTAHTAR